MAGAGRALRESEFETWSARFDPSQNFKGGRHNLRANPVSRQNCNMKSGIGRHGFSGMALRSMRR
jgi:hypothetical protein